MGGDDYNLISHPVACRTRLRKSPPAPLGATETTYSELGNHLLGLSKGALIDLLLSVLVERYGFDEVSRFKIVPEEGADLMKKNGR